MTADEARVRSPHPALRGLVAPYVGYRYDGLPPGLHRGLPSTLLTVVLSFDDPLDVGWLGDDPSRGSHWAMASGLHVGPAAIRHGGSQHGVQLGLTPAGARVLLGLPAGGLLRALVPLEDLLGAAAGDLYDEVAGAPTWAARFAALDRQLLARASRLDGRPVRPEIAWAWREVERTRGRVRVEALADQVGWSRRHLGGRFAAEFGLSPKQAARVARFGHARSLLPGTALSAVAAEAGYADQAHLTREWRELAGCTPTTWLREEFPFLQDGGARVAAG